MSSQLDQKELAKELAKTFFDSVTYYCWNISGDTYLDCLYHHSPENVDRENEEMVTSYLEDELGKEELDKILENTDSNFWEEFSKEYEKLWLEELAKITANRLGDFIIKDGLENIVKNGNYEKLEKYKNVLNELRSEIAKALKTQKPLSYSKLEEYLLKLYKIAGLDLYDDFATDIEDAMFIDCNDYNDKDECVIDFLMSPYSNLDEAGMLVALETLLYNINKIFSRNT